METLLWTVLDITLAVMLLALGWASMASPDLRRGVVLFIAFGMLLALVWARLRAPDLALAEAVIGAGAHRCPNSKDGAQAAPAIHWS